MYISKTARQGEERAVHLEDSDKQAARDGQDVFFRSDYLSGGTHGTYWRKVKYYPKYKYFSRVPSQEEIEALDAIIDKS